MDNTRKILVIDGDAAACDLIGRALTARGMQVSTTGDARTGFDTARTMVPDLIFIDLMLPGVNGLKVSKAIHAVAHLKDVPVIMFVAQDGDLDPKYTATIGVVDVMVKPLTEGDVLAKVRSILGDGTFSSGGEADEEESIEIMDAAEGEPAERYSASSYDNAEEIGAEPVMHVSSEDEVDAAGRTETAHAAAEHEAQDLFTAAEPAAEEQDLEKDRSSSGDISPEEDTVPEYEPYADEEPATSPVRRGLMIVGTIAAGIVIGIGGYLFFTAGKKQPPIAPAPVKVLPAPDAVAPPAQPTPPAAAEKPGAIPEIPVKQEPSASAPAEKNAEKNAPDKPKAVTTAKKPSETSHKPQPAVQSKSDSSAGDYIVQAGVFGKKENADSLAARIRKAGFASTVEQFKAADGTTQYRVVAGTGKTLGEAKKAASAIVKKGFPAMVRRK